jgi:hypothetical protein
MEQRVRTIIENASDKILASAIVDSILEVKRNFSLSAWKTSELDAGHFVEAVRRFINLKLFGSYLPVGRTLPSFDSREIAKLESASGDESYRIHIPRLLWGIYGIRNKRGVGHISLISPNYMDATYVVASCNWILAEIVRLESGLSIDETTLVVNRVIRRNIDGIWNDGAVTRILVSGLSVREEILYLLYDKSPQRDNDIQGVIECKNCAYFRKVLKQLHSERNIELGADGMCIISPKGIAEAETIIINKGSE